MKLGLAASETGWVATTPACFYGTTMSLEEDNSDRWKHTSQQKSLATHKRLEDLSQREPHRLSPLVQAYPNSHSTRSKLSSLYQEAPVVVSSAPFAVIAPGYLHSGTVEGSLCVVAYRTHRRHRTGGALENLKQSHPGAVTRTTKSQ